MDPAAPASVHDPAARNRHVQPERESTLTDPRSVPLPPEVLLLLCSQVVEPVDQLLQKVDPGKDRELWVKENKTGEVRPVDMDI